MAGLQEFALDWAHHRSETLKLLSALDDASLATRVDAQGGRTLAIVRENRAPVAPPAHRPRTVRTPSAHRPRRARAPQALHAGAACRRARRAPAYPARIGIGARAGAPPRARNAASRSAHSARAFSRWRAFTCP